MKIGDPIKYHSPYRTGIYNGTITAINDDGTVAIAVEIPSMAKARWIPVWKGITKAPTPYNTDAINLRSVTYGPNGLARPI